MKEITYELHRLEWHHIDIEIRYCPEWLVGHAHIEVESLCRSPLPITETGFRSVFTTCEAVEESGGPIKLIESWLDEEASSSSWKLADATRKQLTLF